MSFPGTLVVLVHIRCEYYFLLSLPSEASKLV